MLFSIFALKFLLSLALHLLKEPFKTGSNAIVEIMIPANIKNTTDQLKYLKRNSAVGGPIICPTEPTAVAIPSAIDLFASDVARPTMAKITPKPVPATPKPTKK